MKKEICIWMLLLILPFAGSAQDKDSVRIISYNIWNGFEWGHPHAVLLKTMGYPVGLTSRYPIEVKEKILKGLHHGALHCKTLNKVEKA